MAGLVDRFAYSHITLVFYVFIPHRPSVLYLRQANLLLFFQISHACFLGSLMRNSFKHSSLMPPSCGGGLLQLAILFTNNKLERERGGGCIFGKRGKMQSDLSDFIC